MSESFESAEDDVLFAELAAALRGIGGPPTAAELDSAQAARDRLGEEGDGTVAELAYDSLLDELEGAVVRDGTSSAARRLTFYGDETSLHVTSTVDLLSCRLDPAEGARLTLVTADGDRHAMSGARDFELTGPPAGLVRLESVSPAERLVTPWFRL